jgi:hypothetical protein
VRKQQSRAARTTLLVLLRSSHAVALSPDFCFGSTAIAPIVAITQSSAGARRSRASTTMP